jgi:2-polyprenyl-3-methyl-5-hydroxy-6-metoxy-1,4-benzoquinol methylase
MVFRASCNLCRTEVDTARQLAFVKDGIEIVRCPTCGLVFRGHPPSLDELTEIYGDSYFRDDPARPDRKGYADYRADEAAHRRNAQKRLEMIGHLVPRSARILDVGCAAGFFVAEARKLGWDAEGIDIAHEIVDWGRQNVTDRVEIATIRTSHFSSDSLAAVTMWDYIEHSIDARADLEHAYEILTAGGIVAISTGDIESLVARLSGKWWHLLTPRHHNFFFGRTTLVRMLRDVGFELVDASHVGAWYAPGHLMYKLQDMAPGRMPRTAAQRLRRTNLGRYLLPINLFDIVTVVAREPAGG